jgi:hypothetical protein
MRQLDPAAPRRPARRLAAALAVAAAASWLAPAASAQELPPPQVTVAEPIWDAGIVARGTKVVHEFVLHNRGVQMMAIREVRPSCGCTVVSYDPSIPPGGDGRVRAELDTEGLMGAIAKEVTVFTGDPANPAVQLTIRAQVQPALDAQPGYFRFVHVQGAPAESARQVIWSPDFPALEVLSAVSSLPFVTVTVRQAKTSERLVQSTGDGKQWVVEATLASEPPPGPLAGTVTIATNHPRRKSLEIPLAGFVRQQLAVAPPAFDFGTFDAGQPRRGSLLVTNYGSEPVELLGVDTDVRGLTARIDEREKGKRYDLILTLSADVPKGALAGSLRVRTTSPRHPVLQVPVKGVAR